MLLMLELFSSSNIEVSTNLYYKNSIKSNPTRILDHYKLNKIKLIKYNSDWQDDKTLNIKFNGY